MMVMVVIFKEIVRMPGVLGQSGSPHNFVQCLEKGDRKKGKRNVMLSEFENGLALS